MSDAGQTLVLIHGLLDDSRMWEPQAAHLAPYARVVTPDILEQETVGEAARHVLDSVEGPFAVGGFSMGGYVVFEMLRRAPERITKIALIATGAHADTPEKIAEREQTIALAEAGKYATLVGQALPNVLHPSRIDDDALMGTLKTMALRVGAEAYCRQQRIIMSRPESRADLPGIGCPALVICGRQDTLTPPLLSEEMAAGIPNAELVLVEDANHYVSMEQPHAVSALLQHWLVYR